MYRCIGRVNDANRFTHYLRILAFLFDTLKRLNECSYCCHRTFHSQNNTQKRIKNNNKSKKTKMAKETKTMFPVTFFPLSIPYTYTLQMLIVVTMCARWHLVCGIFQRIWGSWSSVVSKNLAQIYRHTFNVTSNEQDPHWRTVKV